MRGTNKRRHCPAPKQLIIYSKRQIDVVEIHEGRMQECLESRLVGEQAELGERETQKGFTGEAAFEIELKDRKDLVDRVWKKRRKQEMSGDRITRARKDRHQTWEGLFNEQCGLLRYSLNTSISK